jgi:hypothetical protein
LILGDKSGNGNELKGLPESIVQLKNLRTLNLFSNKLSTLPPSLCNLKKLEKLYLPYNNVASIPDCIFSMPELKDLNLYGNPLAKAPDSLVNFSPGSTLYLGDNNLSEYEDLKLAYLLQRREYKLGAPTDSFVIEPPLPAIDTLIYTFYQGPVEFPHNYRAKVTRNKVTWYELKGKTATAKKVTPITEQEFIRLAYTADRFFFKEESSYGRDDVPDEDCTGGSYQIFESRRGKQKEKVEKNGCEYGNPWQDLLVKFLQKYRAPEIEDLDR